MKKYIVRGVGIVFIIFAAAGTVSCSSTYTSEGPQLGSRYKIIGPVYFSGIYLNLNNRQLNKQLAFGDLSAVKFSGPEVAFQEKVPVGTVMTIISPAKKGWRLFYFVDEYVIKLEPDISRELEVELALNRGIEGNLDGLNPELFSRL